MRAALALLPVLLAPAVLPACESTAEKSARVAAQGRHTMQASGTLKAGTPAPGLEVRRAVLVRGAGGTTAAAVELRNSGSQARSGVPVLITVRDRRGAAVYRNDTLGVQPSLQRLAVVRPGRSVWWVNDQLLATGRPRSVQARVGAAPAVAHVPDIRLERVHFTSDAAGRYLTGIVRNRSGAEQRDVPVFAVAQRGGRVVAAGRALVPRLPVSSPKPVRFRLIFVGNPKGARLALTVAPPVPSKETPS